MLPPPMHGFARISFLGPETRETKLEGNSSRAISYWSHVQPKGRVTLQTKIAHHRVPSSSVDRTSDQRGEGRGFDSTWSWNFFFLGSLYIENLVSVVIIGIYLLVCRKDFVSELFSKIRIYCPRPQLFKSWIAQSKGKITIQRISIKETNYTIQRIEIYPVESVIHLLKNLGQLASDV